VVPIIGLSDQTHLTNFSGDKKAWLVYMTISNILSKTKNSPAKMSVLLVALLPVQPKLTGKSSRADETQRQINADSLRAVFDLVLARLHYVSHEGMVMDCADGKTRLCFPILLAWIADHAEHTTFHGIGRKSCPKCEVPCNEVGANPRDVYEVRDYTIYEDKARQLESGEAGSTREYFRLGFVTGPRFRGAGTK